MKSLLLSLGTAFALTAGAEQTQDRPADTAARAHSIAVTDLQGKLGGLFPLPLCISCWPSV